jgi:hypothetical protein
MTESVNGMSGLGEFVRQAAMGLMVIEPLPDVGGKGYEVGFFPTESCQDAFSARQELNLHKTDSARGGKREVCGKKASFATLLCGFPAHGNEFPRQLGGNMALRA